MNNYYSNFQRFDHKGNRLSIFGIEKDGMLEVFILKCNKNDRFSKNIAKSVYETWFHTDNKEYWKKWLNSFHPTIHEIPIMAGMAANYVFKQFCNLYYKKYTTRIKDSFRFSSVQFEYQYLQCENEIIPIKNSLKFVKNGR